MTKKKAKAETPENVLDTEIDPFMGGEDDDLAGMEYIQNEDTTMRVDTQPPETKEEADMLAEQADAEAKSAADKKEEAKEDESEEQEVEAKTEEVEDAKEEEPVPDEVVEESDKKIPKDRFDEVNDRMKKAEDEVKSLKTQLETVVEEKNEPEPEPYDYAAQDKAAMDALLEGDADKYESIQSEIRTALRDETLREAKKLAAQGDQQLQENMTFEEAGAKIEVDFPQFVEGTEAYNHDAREEMLDLYVGYAKSGAYTRVQALQRAADKTARMYGLTAVTDIVEEVVDAGNVVNIKPTDAKGKAKVANAQPPAMEGSSETGREEPRTDINSMSDEEFDGLPESTKMRMRGDIL